MPRKIAYQNGNISSLTCYNVEASNPGCFSTTALALTTTRTIPLLFGAAGNYKGVTLMFYQITDPGNTREIVVTLQENVASVWTARASVTKTAAQITVNTDKRGCYTKSFVLATPYAVDTTSNKWRLSISHGAGTGTWLLLTSNGTIPFYEAFLDTTSSFTSGSDSLGILEDVDVTVDASVTFLGTLGTGETTRALAGYSCGSSDVLKTNVHGLVIDESSSRTVTVNGVWVNNSDTPVLVRIGQTTPISITNKVTIELSVPTNGTISQVQPAMMNWAAPVAGKAILALEGISRTNPSGFLTAQANSGQPTIAVDFDPTAFWLVGDKCLLDWATTAVASQEYIIDSMTSSSITFTTNLLATYPIEAKVYNIEKSIEIKSDNTTNRVFSCGQVSHLDIRGVHFSNIILQISVGNINQQTISYADTANRSQWEMEDISVNFSTGTQFIQDGNVGEDGLTVTRLVTNNAGWFRNLFPVRNTLSKRTEFMDSSMIYGASRSSTGNLTAWSIVNCRFFGSPNNVQAFSMGGTDFVFTGNKINRFVGGAGGFIQTASLSGSRDWSNNTFDNCTVGISFIDTGLVDKVVFDGDSFTNGTTDYLFTFGAQVSFLARNIPNITTNITSIQNSLSPSSKVVFEQYTGQDYYNFTYTPRATKSFTGASLPDVEVRVPGTHNYKIAPINLTDGGYHDFKVLAVPNKAVLVNGFIKKNALMQNEVVTIELYLPGIVAGVDTPSASLIMPNTTNWETFSLSALYPIGNPSKYATLRVKGQTIVSGAEFYIADIYNGTNEITNLNTYEDGEPSPIMFEQLGDAQAAAIAVWSDTGIYPDDAFGGLNRNNLPLIPAAV